MLLDRALAVYLFAIRRAHAQQDQAALDLEQWLDADDVKKHLTSQWDKLSRDKCDKVFSAARGNRVNAEGREVLAKVIAEKLAAAGRERTKT